jgi:hypothetical protein
MYTVHLGILGMVHNLQWIAEIESLKLLELGRKHKNTEKIAHQSCRLKLN